jgi:hypothetical protein
MTPAVADPATTAPAGAADLLLVRLLPTTKSAAKPKDVRGDLDRCLPRLLTANQWEGLVAAARAEGLVAPRGLRLTDAGRARALAVLGIDQLPANCPWRTVEARYLAPVAAGLKPPEPGRKAPDPRQLAARALAGRYALPLGSSATLPQAFVALVGRKLGFPGETDLNRLARRVLSREIGSDETLSKDDLVTKVPRVLLDLPGGRGGVRTKLVREWLTRRSTPARPVEPAEFDLPAFSATVRAAARHCPTGRFGERSVFINHLWRYLQNEPNVPRLELPEFKRRLVEANTARVSPLPTPASDSSAPSSPLLTRPSPSTS